MVSTETQQEIEGTLGQVPGWMETIAPPASEHSWGIMRDLILGETELAPREKALVGLGVAAAMGCPYCQYFHSQEAQLAGVSEAERKEAVTVAGSTEYFSTVLHGNAVDHDEFVADTDEMVAYLEEQGAAQAGAD